MKKACSIKGCDSKTSSPYECDICMRPVCVGHHVMIDSDYFEQKPPLLKDAIEHNVRGICLECLLIAELKEIDSTPTEDLPLLINRRFIMVEAQNYYNALVTGEKRDPHILDFFMDIVKDLVKKIKEEENKR